MDFRHSQGSNPPTNDAGFFREGRRLEISDGRHLFHPAFFPQVVCRALTELRVNGKANIWPGGAIFDTGKVKVALFMHGAFVEHRLHDSNRRRHGCPERLQILDLLVKGKGLEDSEAVSVMKTLRSAVSDVRKLFWPSLKWRESRLLPTSVSNFFFFNHQSCLLSLPDKLPNEDSWDGFRRFIVGGGLNVDGEKTAFSPLSLACHEGDLCLLIKECAKFKGNTRQLTEAVFARSSLNDMSPVDDGPAEPSG